MIFNNTLQILCRFFIVCNIYIYSELQRLKIFDIMGFDGLYTICHCESNL